MAALPALEPTDFATASLMILTTNRSPASALNSSVTAGWFSSVSSRWLRPWVGSRKLAWSWIFLTWSLIAGVVR